MDVESGPLLSAGEQQVPGTNRRSFRRPVLVGVLALCLIGLCVWLVKTAVSSLHLQKSFSPAVIESDSLNVLVLGDWGRKGLFNQSAVAERMGIVGAEMNVEFIISVGDNFYENGLTGVDDPSFTESFSQIYIAESLQKTWHAVLGNHDYRGNVLAQLDPQLKLRDSRWHCERAFTLRRELGRSKGNPSSVDFFFYDTNPFVEKYWNEKHQPYDWRGVEPKEDYLRKQREFLSSGLESSNATWKIVLAHHPIRSVGEHGDTVELAHSIYPILKANDVDLYVNGHDHCLEHITESGIHFLTSGGGSKAWRGINSRANKTGLQFYYDGQGFMSLSISPTTIQFFFYDARGNTLHGGNLSKSAT